MTGQQRPLYLHEYRPRSELVTERHLPQRSRFPSIDAHGHFAAVYSDLYAAYGSPGRADVHALKAELQAHGIRRAVNLDGFWDGFLGLTVDGVLKALEPAGDFFVTYVSLNTDLARQPGFEAHVRKHLRESRAQGARGIKLFKHVSLMKADGKGGFLPGRNLRADDPRLAVVWETAAELGMPVLIHIGDPAAFFRPVDGFNERYEELLAHPDWQYGGPGLYRFEELMEMQCNLLRSNPRTTFLVAHGGSNPENLGFVSECLESFPNMHIDIAERIAEFGRQPYTARRFFQRWQDRILFGTDAYPGQMGGRYPPYFRFLETWDEYFDWSAYNTRWKIYGIGLEDAVLEKIYFRNAERVLGL